VAESLQTLYQSSGSSQEVAFVEVVAAQFSVRGSLLQHMVADSQDGAGHRNDWTTRAIRFWKIHLHALRKCHSRIHGSWNDVKHRYLGVEFVVKGEIHYGWARLKTSCNPGNRKITALLTGYAYETIANKPIIAGATKGSDDAEPATSLNTATPEPATLGMLALGERGLSIWRREEHE
jgi:hypothetical protein